ncbi:Leucine-responsive regulatory protein [Burkholderiales bacterium]|nr:Leucine-responsive regulatory protein [Burkholderiales bacterium]
MDLDALDLRLLDQLQRDASLTNLELAERVHVSPATALRRTRRLVEEGVIERTVALLSTDKLAPGLSAVVEVTLEPQTARTLDAFEARATSDEAVQQCYRTASGPDFVLLATVVDMPAWHAFLRRVMTDDAHVRNVKSYFVTKRAKFAPAIPLASGRPRGQTRGQIPVSGV